MQQDNARNTILFIVITVAILIGYQMLVLQPQAERREAMLEAQGAAEMTQQEEAAEGTVLRPDNAVLMVTHYQRLLNYIEPDYVHVMTAGQIIRTGGKELALELETRGYDWVREAQRTGA